MIDSATKKRVSNLIENYMPVQPDDRRHIIDLIFSDISNKPDIDPNGSPREFALKTVSRLIGYGEISEGRHSLNALLDYISSNVGTDVAKQIAELQKSIEHQSEVQAIYPPTSSIHTVSSKTQKRTQFGISNILVILLIIGVFTFVGFLALLDTFEDGDEQFDKTQQLPIIADIVTPVNTYTPFPESTPTELFPPTSVATEWVIDRDFQVAWQNTEYHSEDDMTSVEIIEINPQFLLLRAVGHADDNSNVDWRVSSKRNALEHAAVFFRSSDFYSDLVPAAEVFIRGNMQSANFNSSDSSATLVLRLEIGGN